MVKESDWITSLKKISDSTLKTEFKHVNTLGHLQKACAKEVWVWQIDSTFGKDLESNVSETEPVQHLTLNKDMPGTDG